MYVGVPVGGVTALVAAGVGPVAAAGRALVIVDPPGPLNVGRIGAAHRAAEPAPVLGTIFCDPLVLAPGFGAVLAFEGSRKVPFKLTPGIVVAFLILAAISFGVVADKFFISVSLFSAFVPVMSVFISDNLA